VTQLVLPLHESAAKPLQAAIESVADLAATEPAAAEFIANLAIADPTVVGAAPT
jgi:hypothetical protein